jgi:hypothetical protein
MPQKTNLNINPYYDDFDKDNNFYKVLFKPGYPVQARELTTLQSILQNQIESFGSHIFKEGSMVIPGNINYDSEYYSIRINQDHLGIPVSLYAENLVGKRLTGQDSGVTVIVDKYLSPSDSTDITDLTLFIKYLNSGSDNTVRTLNDGEVLITEESFVYGNTSINAGDTVATLVSLNASAIGCAVGISQGVYFIRGTFVDVATDKIVLDPYSNTPSYRVGLNILEEIVTAKDDSSLYDNARGFSNFAAPGADRLKISTVLSKKPLTDFNDKSFVELIRLDNGEVKKLQNKSEYSVIKDYFAKRTYEESGDYSVDKFNIQVANSLNDGISNEGIYLSTQTTDSGNIPSDDLMCIKVSPGKAYVRGFDIEKQATTILDVDKPRDKATVNTSLVPFEMGNLLRVNNVTGTPFVGINTSNNTVTFFNQRKASEGSGTGDEIGQARVYSFSLSDAPYSNDSSEWELYLFDVQTFTKLTLNQSLNSNQCPATSFIRGVSSNASGYVVTAASGVDITLTQTSGTFIAGEQILINESSEYSRSVKSVKVFSTQDIKSVFQGSTSISSGIKTSFVADTVLQRISPPGFNITDRLTITGGVSAGTVTCPGKNFLGIRSDAIIRYQVSGLSTETYNRVVSVSSDGLTMTVAGISSVFGVCNGGLPSSTQSVTFSIGVPNITNDETAGLYAPLDASNISDVSLANSNLLVTSQLRELTTNSVGSLSVDVTSTGISSAFFETFDAERYSIHYSNGDIEDLTSDQFTLNSNGSQIVFSGLRTSQSSNVTLNTTVRKNLIRNKQKDFIRSQKLIVNKSISGISTALSGLSTNQFYGLRVQDKEISLNVPDVVNIVGVYESLDTSNPTLDKLTFVSGLSLDTNSILGERIVGSSSGAIAQLATRSSATEVEICYLTPQTFTVGETVTFEESNIVTNIQVITVGNYLNITNRFDLDKGQKEQYYDYSKAVRKINFPEPTRKLLIVYNCYSVPSNDLGDLYTVESYAQERFTNDIPILRNSLRSTDTLDFRPRVSEFTSTTSSPFAFASRTFGSSGNNPTLVVTPNESSLIGYSYYLPRIDKLVLDSLGNFSLIRGVSALDPKEPTNVESAMDIATINLPAYLYNPDDAVITLVDNRRYTMRDIGKLDDRISNLETVTSLSLLELDTKTLQVQDADGLSRFKSGFFVDDFKNNNLLDILNPDCKCDIDVENQELNTPLDFYSLKPELSLLPSINTDTADFSANLELLDSNVRKTGDLVTLDYEETGWIEQPLASRVENVNPFNMIEFVGRVQLSPASDNWVRNVFVSGGERTITGDFDGSYVETIKISSEPDTHIRSRNVAFGAGGLKPITRYYPFFDSTSGIDIVPKLLEITMTSGIFQNGETVDGFIGGTRVITFRTCQPNHKTGDINNPATTFNANPYNTSISLPSTYSASSTVLNVDVASLSEEAQGRFEGYVTIGTVLVGRTSGAQASVSNLRLVSDTFGDIGGAFFFKDPLASPPPPLRFRTGTKTFKLTSSSTNSTPLPGSLLISSAETSYNTSGIVDTFRQTNVIVRRPPPPPPPPPAARGGGKDPLAQTFTVDETGAFLTSVDLFFASKDENEKVTVELRTVELGTPTDQLVQDFARVTLEPSQVNTSTDGSVATRVTFPSPVYLQPGEEYAIVILSPSSNNYETWIARMGERTVDTQNLPDAESVIVTKQYLGGSLFKSQNGTIWTPSQFEDLKFKLYKAQFTQNLGTVYFYNPKLGTRNSQTPRLSPNPIKTLPRKLKVGITTTSTTSMANILTAGRKVGETNSSGPYGYIENVGSRISALSLTNAGVGYSNGTFSGVSLYSVTGNGSGAVGVVTISSNVVSAVSITTPGNGYVIGDVLGVTTSNVVKGSNATITVSNISGVDTLYLTNVQGEEFTDGQDLVYYENTTAVALANTDIRGTSSLISNLYDGRVIEVDHYNHGMMADNNKVTLADIEPNTAPILLTANLATDATTISVANTSTFSTFEGISTSTGYVKINNEIIYYNSIGSGTLGIGTRGIDGSSIRTHNVNDLCYKYELNGISLTKINATHDMPTDSALKASKNIDKYYLQIDRSNRPSGDTQLSFTDERSLGGTNVFASQNFQYNAVIPQFNVITPGETTFINAELRSVSGTSAGGSEVSFIDQGYESVELNQINRLSSTRLVCSEINETNRLTDLPKNRSTTLAVEFSSQDPNLSPVLDTQNGVLILERNRLNSPVTNYVTDSRVKLISGDPHSAVYITNRVDLKQPATSLKVLVSAYRHSSADFRVLYRLFRPDSSEIEQAYELFPGYDNLRDLNGDGFGETIIDSTLNSGRADAFVPSSRDNQFLEYQFSADNLDKFTGFAIKIVCSGTNEAYAPRFKDLRVIALA